MARANANARARIEGPTFATGDEVWTHGRTVGTSHHHSTDGANMNLWGFKFKEVTEAEFKCFLQDYGVSKLERDFYQITIPEQMQYNDFSLDVWPGSVVAFYSVRGFDEDGKSSVLGTRPGNWKVRVDECD